MSDLISILKNTIGDNGVLTGTEVSERMIHVWYPNPITALCIVRPRNTKEVAEVLKICNAYGQTVVPHGGLLMLFFLWKE